MYHFLSAFAQWDQDIKSFCVTLVYLQTMKGFHVKDSAVVATSARSGLLKK